MEWKWLFSKSDLETGRTLYEAGKAKKLTATHTGYEAVVRDRFNQHVEISVTWDGKIDYLDCNCAKGKQDELCEHMAAALFLVEKKYGITEADEEAFEMVVDEERESDSPLSADSQMLPLGEDLARLQKTEQWSKAKEAEDVRDWSAIADYRYFRPDQFMEGLYIPENTLKKARELVKCGGIELTDVQVGFSSSALDKGMIGVGYGSLKDRGRYSSVHLSFGRNRLLRTGCSNWSCGYRPADRRSYLNKALCEHEVALLLLLIEYLKEHNLGDGTNRSGYSLMGFMPDLPLDYDEREGAPQTLTLVPAVEQDPQGRMRVSFRVGSGKLFKISNLREFHERMMHHESMQFGKNTVLNLGEEFLDDQSRGWMQFIDGNIREDNRRSQDLVRKYQRSFRAATEPTLVRGDIALYGSAMDDFYDLMGEMPVEFTVKTLTDKEKRMVRATQKDIRLSLTLKAETDPDGTLSGIHLEGQVPAMARGHKYSYFLSGEELIRISYELSQKLDPLTGAARAGEIDIRIGRKHLGDFYHKALPELRRIADIEEQDSQLITAYLPPVPGFVFYLDTLDEYIVARADVFYGNQVHSLMDRLKLDDARIPGESYRDSKTENAVMEHLMTYLPFFDEKQWLLFNEKGDDAIFELLDHGLDELLSCGEVRMTDRFGRLGMRRRTTFSLGVSVESNLMDLQLTSEELSEEELLDILSGYQRKIRYVRLKNGDFFKLEENETIQQLISVMETLQLTPGEFVKGKMHLPAYRALYLDKMLEQAQDVYADRDQHFRKLVKDFKTVQDADYPVPGTLRGVLRKYQNEGFRWLRTLDGYGFGGILADEMGLGKTLQVIAAILGTLSQEREEGKETKPSLVVCPASLVYNWGEELRRFAPELHFVLVSGTKSARTAIIEDYREWDVMVTSYDLLKRDIHQYEGKMFRFEIIDEAQYIKNQQTAAAKAVKLIAAQTKFALTGTPIENRLSELWSIFDYLMPGFLYDYSQFHAKLEAPIVKSEDKEAAEQLKKMVSPFVLRRLKKDVLKDLPDKLEEVRYAGMEEKQRKLYNAQVVRMRNHIRMADDETLSRSRIEILAELTKIRQICCDPSLLFEDYDGNSAKREACLDLIRSAIEGGHRILVFSQFTSMLELLQKDLDKENIGYYVITGATPKERRVDLVNQFNEGEVPVFLISLKAGGTGLNLTGADIVIHYDPWWNVAAQNQATDRAHRIGQKRVVTVYKLIMQHTIEEKILQMQEAKKQLADDILGAESVSSSTLSRDELLSLLEQG